VTYPFLAGCLWLLAWLMASIVIAAAWAVLRGHGAALAVLLAAAFAAVMLAWSGAVLW
jgi:hypothetical protein